jgi:hypothetical protein
MTAPAPTTWTSDTRLQIRALQDGLLETAARADEHAVGAEIKESLLRPFRKRLDQLYERDLPIAKLADESDILLHVVGPFAEGPIPRVSLVAHFLSRTRDQVTRLAKQLGGFETAGRVPASLDMGLVGLAEGSLFIGFSAEADEGGDLTRDAVRLISDAGWLVSENRSVNDLADKIQDPAARDMAIAAVRHLSPSGQMGVREIEVYGREVGHSVALTIETRRLARSIMGQRADTASTTPVSFVGTVREVDLDASRFEIRNVDGYPEPVRCAHELEEAEVKALVDRRVRVRGKPEVGANGLVRLLWIDEVDPLL